MSSEQFDDLAAHFMSGPGPKAGAGRGGLGGRYSQPPPALGSNAPVTLLVCGNLPTFAAMWVPGFVDRIARSTGPVALVRMEPGMIRAEVIRPGGRAIAQGDGWLASVQRFATRWMIGVGERASAAEIVGSGKPIDFLSGIDEAAMAAARARIGALVATARDAGLVEPRVTVTLVGASEEAAAAAATTLLAWAREQLGMELDCAAPLPRIDRLEAGGFGGFSQLPNQSLAEVIQACITVSAPASSAAPAETPWRPAAAPSAPRPAATSAGAPRAASPASPPLAPPPAAAKSSPPIEPSPTATEDLSLWFEDLTGIAFRSPASPTVTLATDGSGVLHLLARESSLDALRRARVWAQQHWQLLCAAQPALGATEKIVEHIMLNRAADGARLHGLGVRLHALVQIRVDGLEVRRRIDLNDESTAG